MRFWRRWKSSERIPANGWDLAPLSPKGRGENSTHRLPYDEWFTTQFRTLSPVPTPMTIVGLDIGGANLKAADGRGRAAQRPFPLWKHPERLTAELRELLGPFGPIDRVAVTMTGELCDCFASKSEGVRHILASVPGTFVVWTIDGQFASLETILADPLRAAASNWLALATYVGRHLPTGPGLLIDLGSTTCDLIPLLDGRPIPLGRTDPDRLASGELVYCGVRRTPLCALFGLELAAEWFATTEDVYVTLGDLPENPDRIDTADGRPVTKAFARARLARMECDEGWSPDRARDFASRARQRQVERIVRSVQRVVSRLPSPVSGIVSAGSGGFLIPAILAEAGLSGVSHVSLSDRLGADLSTAACAHAVAVLAEERR